MREVCVEKLAMSTRVAFPIFGCRMSERRPQLLPGLPEQASQVCKNLFGPIDHEENLKFVQDELNQQAQKDRDRWNFDFQMGKPKEGAYRWEPVGEVPPAYEMPRMSYLSAHADTASSPPPPTPFTDTIALTTPTTTPHRPIPLREGVPVSSSAIDQPSSSTSTQNTTTTPTTTQSPPTLDKSSSTCHVTTTTARLATLPSSARKNSSSEATTSRAPTTKSEVIVGKKCSSAGGRVKLTPTTTTTTTTRCPKTRSSQPSLTEYMKVSRAKRPASIKLDDDQPPALKRPKTTTS